MFSFDRALGFEMTEEVVSLHQSIPLLFLFFFPVWSSACVCVQVCLHVFLKSVVCLYLKGSSRRKENLRW